MCTNLLIYYFKDRNSQFLFIYLLHYFNIFYRSINQIKTLLTDLRDKIREIEHQLGCVDELRQQLKEKEQKYGVNIEFAVQLKKSWEVSKLSI